MDKNLLSVSQLSREGYKVSVHNRTLTMTTPQGDITEVRDRGGLYVLSAAEHSTTHTTAQRTAQQPTRHSYGTIEWATHPMIDCVS